MRGAGDDVWDRADALHFVWQTIDGDGEIVARLLSVTQTRSWAKAGVMIRGGLERGAAMHSCSDPQQRGARSSAVLPPAA